MKSSKQQNINIKAANT